MAAGLFGGLRRTTNSTAVMSWKAGAASRTVLASASQTSKAACAAMTAANSAAFRLNAE